jgi:hypothetical protein
MFRLFTGSFGNFAAGSGGTNVIGVDQEGAKN